MGDWEDGCLCLDLEFARFDGWETGLAEARTDHLSCCKVLRQSRPVHGTSPLQAYGTMYRICGFHVVG